MKQGKKRSVLLVGNFLSSTVGTRSVCEDLAVQLTQRGWSVVNTSDKPNRIARVVDMISTVWNKRRDYTVAQVDVYSGMAFVWAEAVCWALRIIGKPYVLTLHGGNLSSFAKRWPKRVRSLLNSAKVVTTPSAYLLDQMAAYRKDLCLCPNPLNVGSYNFRVRNKLAPRLVWIRAFHEIYNPTLAPRAMAFVVKAFPTAHLTMIGPDKGDGSLQATKRAAFQLGVGDRISFVDRVPKSAVANWLDQSDIFLNTTNIDNTPVSVLEAMASGLCVVSTNVGGLSYLLEDGCDSLLVPPDNPDAMGRAINRLLTDAALASELSLKGHVKVQQFDWSIILPKWEQLLDSVAREFAPCDGAGRLSIRIS